MSKLKPSSSRTTLMPKRGIHANAWRAYKPAAAPSAYSNAAHAKPPRKASRLTQRGTCGPAKRSAAQATTPAASNSAMTVKITAKPPRSTAR